MGHGPTFRSYSVNEGLPSTEVYAITTDSKGNLWFSTDLGISKFNGYTFKNFSSRNGLPDNCVFDLVRDHKDRLWFRTFSGRTGYLKNDTVHVVECNDMIMKWLKGGFIRSMAIDKGDTVWIGGSGCETGILKLIPGKNGYKAIPLKPDHKGHGIILNNQIMINYHELNPVQDFNRQTLDVSWYKSIYTVPICDLPKYLSRNSYALKLSDSTLIFTVNECLVQIGENGIISEKKFNKKIIGISEIEGKIWLGFYLGGVEKYNPGNWDHPEKKLLADHSVGTVLKDHENNLWFSTLENGVFYLERAQFFSYTDNNGLSNKKINCISADNNHVYAGLDDGSMIVLDEKGIVKHFPDERKDNPATAVLSFGDHIYFGSAYNIKIFDKNLRKKHQLTKTLGKHFCPSSDGSIWIAGYSSILRIKGGDTTTLELHDAGIRITSIHEDRSGTLWVGTLRGLFYLNKGKLLKYYHPLFPSERKITDICENQHGDLIVSTVGDGVVIKRNQKLYFLNTGNGLSSDMCRSVLVSGNHLFVATNRGVDQVTMGNTPGDFNVICLDVKDGLASNDVNELTLYKGKIYAATKAGITVIDPDNKQTHINPPPVFLDRIIAGGKSVIPGFTELSHNQNEVEFHFTGLSYYDPGNLVYKYKLAGIDKDWKTTTSRMVRYPFLQPGDYKFLVYAVNDDNYQSKTPAIYSFSVLPAFYQSNWFRLLLYFTTPFLFAGIILYRFNLSKAKEKQKHEIDQKLTESKLKALRAQMNPHFIFNSINAIQYFVVKNDRETAQTYLSKFASLVRRVLENSETDSVTLSRELDTLKMFLEIEHLRHNKNFKYKITSDSRIDLSITRIPPMLVQPFVENAIKHGLAYVNNPELKIDIMLDEEDRVKICIEDNGIGIESGRSFIPKQNDHYSIGLKVTKERIELLNLVKEKFNYKLNISEIKSNDSQPLGTRVELLIPIIKTSHP